MTKIPKGGLRPPPGIFGLDYSGLPEHIRDGARFYIENGIEPGGFLQAVICNDLKESFGRADHINQRRMFDIVSWFYNEAPSPCWGSPERYHAWLSRFDAEALR